MIRPGPEERFERFQRPGPNGCLDWTGSLMKNGYGSFRVNGKTVYAHRFAVELSGRGIPKGMHVDHLCRRKCCVNPDHLEVVSCQMNVQRGSLTPLDAETVAEIKSRFRTSGLSGRAFGRAFASEYGVRPGTLANIVGGRSWQNVEAAA